MTRRHLMLTLLSASQVADRMRAENLTRDALMLKLLPEARKNAHPPISNYFVGAVAAGASGNLYLGANIEVPGNPLGLAVHAEQAAIANAYMAEEKGIEAIAVTGAPCGHCRQFLNEVTPDGSLRILLPDSPPLKLSDLLPRAFSPKALGFQQGAFPIQHTNRALLTESHDRLVLEALKAACMSHSPYSQSPSGVALSTSNGRLFAGAYIENVAFNPSLPPLEAALAGYFGAGANAGAIQRAVLVEASKSKISQEATTKAVLSAFAPNARFERFLL